MARKKSLVRVQGTLNNKNGLLYRPELVGGRQDRVADLRPSMFLYESIKLVN